MVEGLVKRGRIGLVGVSDMMLQNLSKYVAPIIA